MLVLSRKKGESILIGDNILVTIVQIKGNVVRLGIDAPEDVVIQRGELLTDSKTPIKKDEPASK